MQAFGHRKRVRLPIDQPDEVLPQAVQARRDKRRSDEIQLLWDLVGRGSSLTYPYDRLAQLHLQEGRTDVARQLLGRLLDVGGSGRSIRKRLHDL